MLFEPNTAIWLCTEPTDMRKSFNGLSALVTGKLNEDVLSGQFFVFINKRKTQMKILYFDQDGFCIWCKRLEQGQFNYTSAIHGKSQLNATQLHLLISGIKIEKHRQYKRYRHKNGE